MIHTPGPWEVTGPNIRQGETRALLFVQEKPFADAEPDPDEQSANARLIALAPTLLQVAKTLCDYADLGRLVVEQANADYALLDEAVDNARAAIAKAEGSEG